VVLILAAGAGALAIATAAANGQYLGTARADLAVQVGLTVVMTVCFVAVHRSSVKRRAHSDDASSEASESVA
jgi:membrane protein implicated in regulation of membrane protease activity